MFVIAIVLSCFDSVAKDKVIILQYNNEESAHSTHPRLHTV